MQTDKCTQSGYLTQVSVLSTGPCGISCRVSLSDIPLEEGMILSDGMAADEFGLLLWSSWNSRKVLGGSSWLLHHRRIKTCMHYMHKHTCIHTRVHTHIYMHIHTYVYTQAISSIVLCSTCQTESYGRCWNELCSILLQHPGTHFRKIRFSHSASSVKLAVRTPCFPAWHWLVVCIRACVRACVWWLNVYVALLCFVLVVNVDNCSVVSSCDKVFLFFFQL